MEEISNSFVLFVLEIEMCKKKYFTSFSDLWLSDSRSSNWLRKVEGNESSAKCSYCKIVDILNMGESGLTSHMKGKKHKERAPSSSTLDFHFQKSSDPVPTAAPKGTSLTLDKTLINSSVLQAEVRWALKFVMSRYSKSSCNNVTELFKIMIPYSDIAKSFTCAKTKCRYMIVYGLAPYFQSCLLDDLKDSAYHVISYVECFNSVLHFGQMDFAIRFWSSSKKLVENHSYILSSYRVQRRNSWLKKIIMPHLC